MTFDEQLRRTFESLTTRVREEADRQLATATAELRETIEFERAEAAITAAAEAKSAAEKEAAAQMTAAVAALEARGREAEISFVGRTLIDELSWTHAGTRWRGTP